MKNGSLELNFNEQLCQLGDNEIVRVVYTRPNHECRLREYCNANGIVCYLPLKKVWKPMTQRHGEKVYRYPQQVLRPMFPNYMFVKMTPEQRALLFRTKDIVRILRETDQNQARLIEEIRVIHQVETIAQTEEIDFNAEIKEGSRFLIETGPWQGVYGWLKKKRGRFVWMVEIECVNTVIEATIDPSKYKMTAAEA